MVKVRLERFDLSDQGTFGRLVLADRLFFTGELPWRNNQPGISCIPTGIYRWVWTFSPRFKRHLYLALDTDPRTGVRIHSANLMGDLQAGYKAQLQGCIALGKSIGNIGKQRALLLSVPAVREFEMLMDRKPFVMEIKNG